MKKKHHLTLRPPYLSLLHFLCPFVLFTFIPSSCFPSFLATSILLSSPPILPSLGAAVRPPHVYFFLFLNLSVSFPDLFLRLVSFLTINVIPLPSFFLFCPPLSLFNFPDLSFLFHTFPFLIFHFHSYPFHFLSVPGLFLYFLLLHSCLSFPFFPHFSFFFLFIFHYFSHLFTFSLPLPLFLPSHFLLPFPLSFLSFPFLSSLSFTFPFFSPSVPQANGSQLSVLKSETTQFLSDRPTCVFVCASVSPGSGHVNRISLFHAQSHPMITDPWGCVECVCVCLFMHVVCAYRTQRPALYWRISGQSKVCVSPTYVLARVRRVCNSISHLR